MPIQERGSNLTKPGAIFQILGIILVDGFVGFDSVTTDDTCQLTKTVRVEGFTDGDDECDIQDELLDALMTKGNLYISQ